MDKKITLNFKFGKLAIAHEFIVIGRGTFEGREYASVAGYQLVNPHAALVEGATKEDKTKREKKYMLIEIFEDNTFTYVTNEKLIYRMLGKMLELSNSNR